MWIKNGPPSLPTAVPPRPPPDRRGPKARPENDTDDPPAAALPPRPAAGAVLRPVRPRRPGHGPLPFAPAARPLPPAGPQGRDQAGGRGEAGLRPGRAAAADALLRRLPRRQEAQGQPVAGGLRRRG